MLMRRFGKGKPGIERYPDRAIGRILTGIRAAGGRVVREPGPMKHGTTVIAFVEDPDGYRVELIEQKP